mmetsp:Transcript_60307/g.110449  ORF Transcript_60307/g.110449 Transcript_60307/m.110449 type:complete len:197 (+) Transcript_60307:111-701(+)
MFGGLFSWFGELFRSLGLLSRRDAKICFLGLDNAGKTTLLHMLKDQKISTFQPTLYPNNEELIIEGIRFRTFDLGGHETARRIWKDYLASVSGIVFIVDAADRTRFSEAREEIGRLLEDPALLQVPFAVLGNKIDIPVAASEDELLNALGLNMHRTQNSWDAKKADSSTRQVELFMCSIVKRMGYAEAFTWLAKLV